VLLALKVAATLSGWTTALRVFIGSEAALTGVEGAAAATTGLLNKRLAILRGLASKPFQFVIAYEIIKKLTGSNADLSNDAGGAGDLLPVYRNGKWVDPITGEPVADQAYWNRYYKKQGNTGKPTSGPDGRRRRRQREAAGARLRRRGSSGRAAAAIYQTGGTGGQFSGPGGSVTYVRLLRLPVRHLQAERDHDPAHERGAVGRPERDQGAERQEQPGDGVYFTGSATSTRRPATAASTSATAASSSITRPGSPPGSRTSPTAATTGVRAAG
jgi:hypothetical protein